MRSTARPPAEIVSVNVGAVRTFRWRDREVATAIHKHPVQGRRQVSGTSLDGDHQADRLVHGGTDKAVYAYGSEDYTWWRRELGRELDPGTFGENLTVQGMDLRRAVIGERWHVGSCVLRVTQPRTPCFKLGVRMDDPRFPARFAAAGRPGAYLAVVEDGEVGAEDEITVTSRPDHGVTVGMVERAYHQDRSLAAGLLVADELPPAWRRWAEGVGGR